MYIDYIHMVSHQYEFVYVLKENLDLNFYIYIYHIHKAFLLNEFVYEFLKTENNKK